MRVLLDTHMIIAIVQRNLTDRFPDVQRVLLNAATEGFVSVASLSEIAIKTRLGKLLPRLTLDVIPAYLQGTGLTILPINIAHVITAADPEPETRACCLRNASEGLQLATVDRLLVDHPLALRL
ncbi:LOW QUALITY PROTEIN: hypothetical protein Rleg5DRAFT_3179 [Rhizobium leguminosarum bv. viciae WSM1455]|nr:LOW QUALITY PROTEIN: hypothetical protein Rleg5DRAFT_3179 [Rhizobium leguminosarum bv. viciae WSM1455]